MVATRQLAPILPSLLVLFMLSACLHSKSSTVVSSPDVEIPEPVVDLIHAATGHDKILSGMPPFPIIIGNPEASHFTSATQTFSGPRYVNILPWRDDQGELNIDISMFSGQTAEQLHPVDWRGRSVTTSDDIHTTLNEVMEHDFLDSWRLFEVTKEYPGSGTLTFSVITNINDTHELAEPWSDYATGFHRELHLFDIPDLPAGHDWQVIFAGDAVSGSLDGVSGTFSCAIGFCYLEDFRNTPAPGYHPGGSEVLFTPDDPDLPEITLQSATSVERLPPTDYLAFGYWLYIPEDPTSVHDYDVGVAAGGGEPFSFPIGDLTGTASYAGSATGLYYTGRSSADPNADTFVGDAMFTADFDRETLEGRVSNFRFNGNSVGMPSELHLQPSAIDPAFDGTAAAAGLVTDRLPNSSWLGEWQAAFYGNGAASTDHPRGLAGTFGTSDGMMGLVGAFGATTNTDD